MEFNIISFLKTCGVCAKKRLSLETVFSIIFTFIFFTVSLTGIPHIAAFVSYALSIVFFIT